MAQGSYMSTYRTYKAGTKRLATWLVQAAKLCGVDSTSFATEKYQIPLGKFVELAETITKSKDPKIKVPREIVIILRTAIALRRETGAILAKLTGQSTKHASQASHRYFVSVLEQVLHILAPPRLSGANEDQAVSGADLSNMFVALTVEEPTLDTDTAPPTATKKKSKKPSQEYEIQDSSADDFLLAVLGFLKDYAEIEKFVMMTWMHYRDGRLNLMAASATTDTAYGMLKRSSEDLLATASGKKKTYWDVVSLFADDKVDTGAEGSGSLSLDVAQYVALPVEDILSDFASILKPNVAPIYNGQYGYYRPDENLKKKTGQQQHLQDKQLLFEYLPEITKMAKANLRMPAEDELTTGLRGMMETNNMSACPMYAIFATKLFLTVHHVLRVDAVQPFEELQATAKRCMSTIDGWLEFSKHKRFVNWLAQNDQWLGQIKALAQDYVLEDKIGKFKVRGIPDEFQPEAYLFMKRNPVYCGLLTLRLNLLLQEGGQTLVGAWGSAIYPLHLYNACRQSGGLEIEWQDAEYIYQLHTAQRVFVGAPPRDPQDYLKRFFLMLGGRISNFARNRRHGGQNMIVESKKGPRGLKTTSPVRDIFQPRYVGDGNAVLSTGNLTALASIANKAQRMHVPLDDVEQLAREITSQPQVTPIQLLTCVQEGLAAEEMHLLFDYFGVHQRGIELLRELKDELNDDLVEYFGEGYIEDESQLPYVVGYIFEIIYGADKAAEHLKLRSHGSEILNKASDILKEFLEHDDTGMQGLMQTRALTRSVQYAHASGKLQNVQVWNPQKWQDAQRGGR